MIEPLRKGLRELGWVEGRNLDIEWRFAEGKPERLPALLAESDRAAARCAGHLRPAPRHAGQGRDAHAADRGGGRSTTRCRWGWPTATRARARNITGPVRRLPRHPVAAAAVAEGLRAGRAPLRRPDEPLHGAARRRSKRAWTKNGASSAWRSWCSRRAGPDDFDAAFAAMARDRLDGVADPGRCHLLRAPRCAWANWCTKQRLPSIWGGSGYLDAGGLASFQGDFAELFRRSASMVDKILKGSQAGRHCPGSNRPSSSWCST